MSAQKKTKILFLCTGNSCRSQMAEGFTRALRGDLFEAHSAGVLAKGLDPLAVTAMAEAGVDISGHRSKNISELNEQDFDYVVTVCNKAKESCPVFPGRTRMIHRGFDDPPELAALETDPAKALEHYRRVRDEIKALVTGLPGSLEESSDPVRSTANAIAGFLKGLN